MPPLRPILIVVALVFAVNLAASYIQPYLLRAARREVVPNTAQIVIYRDAEQPDIIFMGSSRVLFGLDPDLADRELSSAAGAPVRSINLGFIGGAADIQYLAIKNVIEVGKLPKVIVYGVSDFELIDYSTPDGIFSPDSLKHMAYLSLILRMDDLFAYGGQTVSEQLDFVAKQLIPLYRDRDLIRHIVGLALGFEQAGFTLGRLGPGLDALPPGGFRTFPPDLHPPEAQLAETRAGLAGGLSKAIVSQTGLTFLDQSLALARSRGIEVILVNMPVSPAYLQLWGDSARIAAYTGALRQVADRNGVVLVDLYEHADRHIPSDGFFDDHHLNSKGAAALTTFLVESELAPRFSSR